MHERRRLRPAMDQTGPAALSPAGYRNLRQEPTGSRSFYSFAASNAFTALSFSDLVLAGRLEGRPLARRLAGAGLYGLAGFISYTRLGEGKHYFSDVVAGAAAGTLIGRAFHRHNQRGHQDTGESRFRLFLPVLLDGGAALSVGIRLGR